MKRVLLSLMLMLLIQYSTAASIIISQVMYDTPENEQITISPHSLGEFVELYNMGDMPMDMTGWILQGGGTTERYVFENLVLPVGGYVVVAYNQTMSTDFSLEQLYGSIQKDSAHQIIYQKKIILSNSGETLSLYNNVGHLVDQMTYTNRATGPRAVNADTTAYHLCVSLHRISSRVWQTSQVDLFSDVPSFSDVVSPDFYVNRSSASHQVSVIKPMDATSQIDVSSTMIDTHGARAQIVSQSIDIMGRTAKTLVWKGASREKNLLSCTDYDIQGDVLQDWLPLPVVADLSNEEFVTTAQNYYEDNAPFISYVYENSAKKRLLSKSVPGESYKQHPMVYSYGTNAEETVVNWRVRNDMLVREGYYASGLLHRSTLIDDNGATLTVYSDVYDHQLLRSQAEGDTYYVYDDMGRLRYILPPAVSAELRDGSYPDSCILLQQFAYLYRYDELGRMISKKMPGAQPVLMEYDQYDRLVSLQDGNQRQRGAFFTQTEYDEYGRIVLLKEVNRDQTSYERFLKRNFYDDYSFISTLPQEIRNVLTFREQDGFDSDYSNAIGLATGSIIYDVSDSDMFTITALFYDNNGRIIQQHQYSPLSSIHSFSCYNFDGTVRATLSMNGSISERYSYSYDHLGRPLTVYYQLNDSRPLLLTAYTYDELGHCVRQTFHNGQRERLTDYNLRNQLIQVEEGTFLERLFYESSAEGSEVGFFNGLISSSVVHQGEREMTTSYAYDLQNRLTDAIGIDEINGTIFEEKTEYDIMGNILHLQRSLAGDLVDDLYYSYAGNQLEKIADEAGSRNSYTLKEYQDFFDEDIEMSYDANGNLVQDLDRNILEVRYNIINLPEEILFSNGGRVVNHYNAAGTKWKVEYFIPNEIFPDPLNPSTDSVSFSQKTVIFQGDQEVTINNLQDTTILIRSQVGYAYKSKEEPEWKYFYNTLDHLGNVREVWSPEDGVIQSTMYHHWGMPMYGSFTPDQQELKYNGKPYIEMHGLDVYDYGFRNYYATIGRFSCMDPLAEQTPWQSPYIYADNNPICNIDWMGLSSMGFSMGLQDTYNWVAINRQGKVVKWGDDNSDYHVYLVDDDWDKNYESLTQDMIIGWEIDTYGGYIEGFPCYYIASTTYASGYTIYGGQCLVYGLQRVQGNVDSNTQAVWAYFMKGGKEQPLGDNAMSAFLSHPDVRKIISDLRNNQTSFISSQTSSIDMRADIFHIGKTTVQYYATPSYIVISGGVEDSFSDPNFILEERWGIPTWQADHMGPNLEVWWGTPYYYIPCSIMIPRK